MESESYFQYLEEKTLEFAICQEANRITFLWQLFMFSVQLFVKKGIIRNCEAQWKPQNNMNVPANTHPRNGAWHEMKQNHLT